MGVGIATGSTVAGRRSPPTWNAGAVSSVARSSPNWDSRPGSIQHEIIAPC